MPPGKDHTPKQPGKSRRGHAAPRGPAKATASATATRQAAGKQPRSATAKSPASLQAPTSRQAKAKQQPKSPATRNMRGEAKVGSKVATEPRGPAAKKLSGTGKARVTSATKPATSKSASATGKAKSATTVKLQRVGNFAANGNGQATVASAKGNGFTMNGGKANGSHGASRAAADRTGTNGTRMPEGIAVETAGASAKGRSAAPRAPRMSGEAGASALSLPSGYRPSESEPFMNERQRLYFRNKLIAWKDEIVRLNRETLEGLHQDSAQHADLADRATFETDRALELRARDRQRKLISKIDAALARIEEGTYGYCEETGEPISLKRLDARPIATLSIEAQERHERRERVFRED